MRSKVQPAVGAELKPKITRVVADVFWCLVICMIALAVIAFVVYVAAVAIVGVIR